MPFKDITEQNHEIRPKALDLSNPVGKPGFAELRTEVQVGQRDNDRAIHRAGKTREAHLVVYYLGRTQTLNEGKHRKHASSNKGQASQFRC